MKRMKFLSLRTTSTPLAYLIVLAVPLFSQITYQTAPDADQKKTLLLRDFHPRSMLHAAVHSVERAKFPVIDVHQHVDDAMGIGDRVPPARLVEIMDRTNVKTIVILTGMWGDKLQKVLDELV